MLNHRKMHVIQTADNGIVDQDTIFHFEQKEQVVTAYYSGGKIRQGYLVGQMNGDLLKFTYCQLRTSGELDHGESACVVSEEKQSGKIKLEEKFNMKTEISTEIGINIFMEI